MNRVFATQPTYLPWIGIFHAIEWADEYIFWDDVQYERKSWQNHNVIRNNQGGEIQLTVPIKKAPQKTPITEIQLENKSFYKKHLKTISLNYARAPYTRHAVAYLETMFKMAVKDGTLYSLNETLIQGITKYLGLRTHFTRSVNYGIEGDRDTRPIAFAKHLGATDYLTQEGTRPYFNQPAFDEASIKVHWLNIKPPNHFSIVDYMCRLTPEEIRNLL